LCESILARQARRIAKAGVAKSDSPKEWAAWLESLQPDEDTPPDVRSPALAMIAQIQMQGRQTLLYAATTADFQATVPEWAAAIQALPAAIAAAAIQ
jgi:hypothetical protein